MMIHQEPKDAMAPPGANMVRGMWWRILFASCLFFASTALFACVSKPIPEGNPTETSDSDGGTVLPSDAPEPSRCVANNDGVIDIKEVTFIVGAKVAVKRNQPGKVVTINQSGTLDNEGKKVWDFTSVDTPTRAFVETTDPTGKWFLTNFPQATLLTPTTVSGLSGIFFQVLRVTQDTMFLEGVASEKETPEKDKVLLTYATPVPLLRFPLRLGKEWIVSSKAEGTVGGLPATSTDNYQIKITDRGAVKLPDIQFENALRIEIFVRQTFIGGSKRQLIQVLFFHECFGEVVRVESTENETDTTFTRASLVRYITF